MSIRCTEKNLHRLKSVKNKFYISLSVGPVIETVIIKYDVV
jgi:hypothetical protein